MANQAPRVGLAGAVVVTSIAEPNAALRALAQGCAEAGYGFYVIGDVPSPPDFRIDHCRFVPLAEQEQSGWKLAELLPKRHYARKNLGYLIAMAAASPVIVETDDDNLPKPAFWRQRRREARARVVESQGWVNVYALFSSAMIWPRGLPLDEIRKPQPEPGSLTEAGIRCPIQQGLVDGDPDVDAVYRLLFPLPGEFRAGFSVALKPGAWCPFNSQNTTWFPEAYPLMYLPSFCTFRMTDIWRSFVAQRIAWENGWPLLFHEADLFQERNVHNLMRDFQDEVPGYLNNRRICEELQRVSLRPGTDRLGENLLICYEALVRTGVIEKPELGLVQAWTEDVERAAASFPAAP
ncbi:MAG: DUF288 domain-containing protein [Bryobacteraceae bacterium]|nr:DUF288 domain-containing protein [Bryobacteraceae bacterium]